MTTRIRLDGRLHHPRHISLRPVTYARIAAEAKRLRQRPGVTLDHILSEYLDGLDVDGAADNNNEQGELS